MSIYFLVILLGTYFALELCGHAFEIGSLTTLICGMLKVLISLQEN
jgi:hypothetical protein